MIGRLEPEICRKMLQNVEPKIQTEISCHYTWLLHGKIARLDDAFIEVF